MLHIACLKGGFKRIRGEGNLGKDETLQREIREGMDEDADTAEELIFFLWIRDNMKRFHTLSFLLALNFFRHSTVSCLCIIEATVERCCGETEKEMLKIKHWRSSADSDRFMWAGAVGDTRFAGNVLILRIFKWRPHWSKMHSSWLYCVLTIISLICIMILFYTVYGNTPF